MSDTAQPNESDVPSEPSRPIPSKRPAPKPAKSTDSSSSTDKRPRFNKPRGKRHGGVGFQKHTPRSNALVSPRTSYRRVYCSSLGLSSFATAIYDWCIAKDYRWGNSVGFDLFLYACITAFIARLAIVSSKLGTRFDRSTSYLKQVSQGIPLPDVICKLIECLGLVSRPQMPNTVPLFPSYQQWLERRDLEMQPAEIYHTLYPDRPIPSGDWALDGSVIADYIERCARAMSKNLGFRTVQYDIIEGRVEMLWGYSCVGGLRLGDLIPMGPCQITQAEAELAAVYGFREHESDVPWIASDGEHLVQPDFQGDPVNAPTFVAALAGSTKETER